jgi:hypothetical protein
MSKVIVMRLRIQPPRISPSTQPSSPRCSVAHRRGSCCRSKLSGEAHSQARLCRPIQAAARRAPAKDFSCRSSRQAQAESDGLLRSSSAPESAHIQRRLNRALIRLRGDASGERQSSSIFMGACVTDFAPAVRNDAVGCKMPTKTVNTIRCSE